MKRFTLTLAILCTFTGLAYAGPEPLPSGKDMKAVVQPMAPACPDWGGFYIGGFGGYKFANGQIDADFGGDWDLIPDERDLLEGAGSEDFDYSGFEAGGLIGYNFQFNNWVFGLEGSGGYLWLRDSDGSNISGINDYHVSTSLKSHYLGTLGPRIGYAFCRWLPYITGGVAIGDVDFDQSFRIPGSDFGHFGSEEETKVGWMAGGGLEYALTNHWRVRAQYQYIDLGSVDFDSDFVAAPTFVGEHEASLKEHNASVAIIFGF